jgi:hypothetical protein
MTKRWPLILALAVPLATCGVWLLGAYRAAQPSAARGAAIAVGPLQPAGNGSASSADRSGRPRLHIESTEHRFGDMTPHESGRHEFVVRNAGDAPLQLRPGGTTCKCTLAELSDDMVPAGGEARIVLQWNTGDRTGPFTHTATVWTNDPQRPCLQLQVTGRVLAPVQCDRQHLVFNDVGRDETRTDDVLLYSQLWEAFEIVHIEGSHPALTWQVEPAQPQALDDALARCGYRLRVALDARPLRGKHFVESLVLTVRPVLPEGPEQQISLMITGNVVSRVELFGRTLDASRVMNVGHVRRGEEYRERLVMLVRDAPQFEITRVVTRPEWLQVSVNELAGASGARRYTLDVVVPGHAPAAHHTGVDAAEVLLHTNLPDLPVLQFYVSFAVLP